VDRSARMETKDVAPLTATPSAGPVRAPASQPPLPASIAPPPPQQHQHQHQQTPSPFAQQQAAPAPGGMRLSFEQMTGKPPGEQQQQQHHHAAPMLYAPPPPQGGNVLGMGDMMRKKRGRPRKYAPDGSMALALAPISSAGGAAPPGQQQHGFSISSPPSDPSAKRRGRPPGSGKKKQFEALGTSRLPPAASCSCARPPSRSKSHLLLCPWWRFSRAGSWGIAFTPHILTVKAGDVRFTYLVSKHSAASMVFAIVWICEFVHIRACRVGRLAKLRLW
jgi:hypothetical protein